MPMIVVMVPEIVATMMRMHDGGGGNSAGTSDKGSDGGNNYGNDDGGDNGDDGC